VLDWTLNLHPGKSKGYNIKICSIELKWDGKKNKIWYDNEMRCEMEEIHSAYKVEQTNDYLGLFIDTYKSEVE